MPHFCQILMDYVFVWGSPGASSLLVCQGRKLKGQRYIHTASFSLQATSASSVCVCVCESICMSCFSSLYVLQAISFDLLKHSPGDYWSNQKAYYLSCALFLPTQFKMPKTT